MSKAPKKSSRKAPEFFKNTTDLFCFCQKYLKKLPKSSRILERFQSSNSSEWNLNHYSINYKGRGLLSDLNIHLPHNHRVSPRLGTHRLLSLQFRLRVRGQPPREEPAVLLRPRLHRRGHRPLRHFLLHPGRPQVSRGTSRNQELNSNTSPMKLLISLTVAANAI